MASIVAVGVPKVNSAGCLIRLCKVPKNHNVVQVATLKRLINQQPRQKPPPFPYWKKPYTFFYQYIDPITYRFDDNSRLVVVDGPPAVGKSKLCESLAKEFGLLYMPAPIHEECYINKNGFDIREMDSKLPLLCRTFDLKRFCENPNDKRTAFFQLLYFLMRFEQYTNALLHILSTGQGVILDRCVYSDIAFVKAMVNAGYLRPEVFKLYTHVRRVGLGYILRPQVIIYLDVPVDLVKDKIKRRGVPYEVNSKVFTTQYLTDLEKFYKEDYLKTLTNHSHLLVYDWSKEGNLLDVCDDIEELDLDNTKDGKLEDWVFGTTADIVELRNQYDGHVFEIYCKMYQDQDKVNWPRELYWSPDELQAREDVLGTIPSEQYEYGYNPFMGDSVMWKVPTHARYSFRRTPRDFINRVEGV